MPKLNEFVPSDVVTFLSKKMPGFKSLPEPHQVELARMFWRGGLKSNRHLRYPDAMSFTYQELEKSFGSGDHFRALNERIGFFEEKHHWLIGSYTKPYWFTESVQRLNDAYMKQHHKSTVRLLYVSGKELKVKAMKTLPAPVASLDSNGNPVKDKSAWSEAKELNKVRVDIDTLRALQRWLRSLLKQYEEGRPPVDLVTVFPEPEVIKRLHQMVYRVIQLAHTDVAGFSCVPHQYEEAPSGRMYALGVSLQTAPSLVKQAALHGRWEYDFSNCHFTLVAQMSARLGYRCAAIEDYLAHKPEVRQEIATAAGITTDDAKQALLSFIYGAKESLDERSAIPKAIGVDAARRLYWLPRFQAIKADIIKSRRLILKKWKRTPNGLGLANDCRKAIALTEPAPSRLAHLVQGAEAAALRVAVKMHPDSIILLEHDGFVSSNRLDPKAIERAVEEELGYRMVLEEKEIRMNPDAQFLKSTLKSEMGRKPNTGAGFPPVPER